MENRFRKRWPDVLLLDSWPAVKELDKILLRGGISDLYLQKQGNNDGLVSRLRRVRSLVHAVFFAHEAHGTVYARISDIVGGLAAKDKIASVPHKVSTPMAVGSMREELKISDGTTVIGRYGSASTFDIPFVQHAVAWISQRRPDIIYSCL
jgi:hypothetical protein